LVWRWRAAPYCGSGVAWTTAGRMIDSARRLAQVAAAATVWVAIGGYVNTGIDTQASWAAGIAAVVLLGTMSLLVRDGWEHARPGSALAACLVALAAAVPLGGLISGLLGLPVSLLVAIAGAAALLAIRVALARRQAAGPVVYNAWIGGVLPVLVLFALGWRGLDVQIGVAWVLAACAVLLLVLMNRMALLPAATPERTDLT
jgi:hypothetical protein